MTSKKSADFVGDAISEDKLAKSFFGEPPFWGDKKLDFLVDIEGGFQADAPTILISD